MSKPLAVRRSNTLRGQRALDAFFASRRNLRYPGTPVLRVAFSISDTPGPEPVSFLIIASKRVARRAHDRNKLKRWIRAAIAASHEWAGLSDLVQAKSQHLTVSVSPTRGPSSETSWSAVKSAIDSAAIALRLKLATQ